MEKARTTYCVTAEVPSESSHDFLQGMVNRVDLSYAKYGAARKNYTGEYSRDFLKDLQSTLTKFLQRWDGKVSQSTTAGGNAILFTFKRLLAYANGFKGPAGNTEYLIDSANGLMIEFMTPQIAGARFEPTDSSGSPGFAGLSTVEAEKYRQ